MSESAPIQAVILAGGLGTRLRQVVSDRPKALVEIAGRPFLSYLLDQLAAAGIKETVLCTGYMADKIEAAFGPAYSGMSLLYSPETSPLGTAGALRLALPLLRSKWLLALNGDSYAALDLRAFIQWHMRGQHGQSIALVEVPDTSRFGSVQVGENDRVLSFSEKSQSRGTGWINAGIYLLGRELIAQIPDGRAVSIEREIFPGLAGKDFRAWRARAPFLDIGTPESCAAAAAFFQSVSKERSNPNFPPCA